MTSIRLTGEQRNALLAYYRGDPDPQVRLRAPVDDDLVQRWGHGVHRLAALRRRR